MMGAARVNARLGSGRTRERNKRARGGLRRNDAVNGRGNERGTLAEDTVMARASVVER
jgi:hypothetical protein